MPARTIGWTNASGRAGFDDACRDEHVGRRLRLAGRKAREVRGLVELTPLQDRKRVRETDGGLRQAAETQRDRPADGGSADAVDVVGSRLRRLQALGPQGACELAQEERDPPRRAEARVDEGRPGSEPERLLDEV